VVALLAVGCGNDSTTSTSTGGATTTETTGAAVTVKLVDSPFDKIVVDGDGNNLYMFTPDSAYGEHATQAWRDDWDITAKATTEPPAELTARLAQVKSECIPPAA